MTIRPHPHPDPATPDTTWRDVPVLGFTVAAGIAVLFCLVWLLRDGLTTDYTWGLLLAPMLMGVAGVAVMVLWERLLVRVPRLAATLVAGGALLAFVLVLAWWLVEVNAQTHLFTGSTFWLLTVAPVCAGLAWLAHRLLPAARRPVREPPAALDDDAWARRLAGVLRLRKDLPDARVAEIVRDARARGAAAGRPLAEELGSPESYAAGVQKDLVIASPPAGLPSSTHAESSMPVMPFMSYAMICGLAIRVGRPAERTDHSTETSGTRATRNASHTRLRHRPSAARRRFSITRVAT